MSQLSQITRGKKKIFLWLNWQPSSPCIASFTTRIFIVQITIVLEQVWPTIWHMEWRPDQNHTQGKAMVWTMNNKCSRFTNSLTILKSVSRQSSMNSGNYFLHFSFLSAGKKWFSVTSLTCVRQRWILQLFLWLWQWRHGWVSGVNREEAGRTSR